MTAAPIQQARPIPALRLWAADRTAFDELIRLRFAAGSDSKTIADMLDIPESYVYAALVRLRDARP